MKPILRILVVLTLLPVIGTIGFIVTEEWNLIDSLYMSVITISTVGFETVEPLTDEGKIFVVCYLTLSLWLFMYCIVNLGELVASGEFKELLVRRRMKKRIDALRNHHIVCGSGRMGKNVCRKLAEMGLPFVVTDIKESSLDEARREGWLYVEGDATDDTVLKEAGIQQAKCLAAVLGTDTDNVFVILSSRILAPDIELIVRASDEKSTDKLTMAGADKVVSPYSAGATKITQLMANPKVEEFMEIVSGTDTEVDLTTFQVDESAAYVQCKLADTDFTKRGVIIVGIRRPDGELLLPPPGDEVIRAKDTLIAVGKKEALTEVMAL